MWNYLTGTVKMGGHIISKGSLHKEEYIAGLSIFVHWLLNMYLDAVFYAETRPPVERGSSVGRMPDSQSREPGFESPLIPFRSLGIFFHFTTPQSTQLYK